jgi:hypothetical protein
MKQFSFTEGRELARIPLLVKCGCFSVLFVWQMVLMLYIEDK